jgi:L-alanine-DL-glutamate epimerase-like enolase superfamily enzyme
MSVTRRQAMAATAATAAMALAKENPMVKIERIELFPMRYPMKGYFKFFTGPHGGDGRAAVIIKMTASDGTIGWGQSVPIAKWSYETLETATIALRDYYAPALIGHDPTDIAGAHGIMDSAIAPGFSTGMPITRAGIDIALHDLVGKLKGQSLAQMWGKTSSDRIKLSWTVNVKSLDDVEKVMGEGSKQGYRNFNIKVGPDPSFDVELAKRVRKNAPDCFLWADANGGYNPEKALEAAPMLADAGVDILEAPLRPNRDQRLPGTEKTGSIADSDGRRCGQPDGPSGVYQTGYARWYCVETIAVRGIDLE